MDNTTEQKILIAAREILMKSGFSGARMQAIADRAEISKSMLNYYFRSKEKLYQAVFLKEWITMMNGLQKAISGEGDLVEKLESFVKIYTKTLNENPELPMFILNEISAHGDKKQFELSYSGKLKQSFQQLIKQIELAKAKGEIVDFEPTHLIVNIVSMCIFPIMGKPVLQHLFSLDDDSLKAFLSQREKAISAFLKSAIIP